jgi:eukaryotic-like serine/threonine-protein kinase
MREYVPSSPAYFAKKGCVAIGCNDSFIYLLDAKTGNLRWKYKTGAEVKASFAYCEKRNLIAFGSFDTNLYVLDIDSGKELKILQTEDEIYSTPLFSKDCLFFTSTDKNLYCYNLQDYNLKWKKRFPGRIFSSPREIKGNIFLGCSDGAVYEIDSDLGGIVSKFDLIERVTNDVVYDKESDLFFASNYANEIYCLKYNPGSSKIVLEMLKNAWQKFKEV